MNDNSYDKYHIGVLDGIRAMAILIIVWFHFWQQSWITPDLFGWLPRYGYLFVDMMILISSYCLFLPYARKMVYGEPVQSDKEFYKKRIARILPSYYFSILVVLLFFALPCGEYNSIWDCLKDLLTHVFLVHNWLPETVASTHLNGVLWTVALEFQFYIIFPLIAKAFTKKPIITYVSMLAVGLTSCLVISFCDNINTELYVNNALTFVLVYANGMLGAWAYMALTKNKTHTIMRGIICTFITVACIFAYRMLCLSIGDGSLQKWQIDYRLILSIVFTIFIICTSMSLKFFRKIFDNRLARFISTISFNLYIWHQFVAVKLKELRIPFWQGDTPPNMTGDEDWKWKYLILCIVCSLAIAIFVTYVIEKPLYKLIMNYKFKKSKLKLEGER